MTIVLLPIVAVVIACALTGLYVSASGFSRLELPNHRSMHVMPVPSGAGVAIVAAVLVLWPVSQGFALERIHILLLAALVGLAALSWMDDRHQLAPIIRLAGHTLAVTLLLVSLEPSQRVLPALPLFVERITLGLAWLWFINLFNFMDGIDGIAGCEAIAVAAGYVAVAAAGHLFAPLADLAVIMAAACAGYLVWNWHPARVFMGDAGSIPLGFLLGWLLMDLACRGHWSAALILPLYFTADATLTLLRRIWRGERPWQPHREHFYQRAVLGGATPPAVVWRINAANVLLIALAVLSTRFPVSAAAVALATVTAILLNLQRLARK